VTVFRDVELAEKTKERLQRLTNLELEGFWGSAFSRCPDPDRALINLERWLKATSNPGTQLSHLSESPRLAQVLIDLLGASQSVADGLIQNPELASLITDPSEMARVPKRKEILDEGRALLTAASSYLHKLDRLRFLKQRWRLPIVVNDLAGSWLPVVVWRAISDLADAILELCLETVWQEYAAQKGLSDTCPVMVVAFGKLGGHELNYSSDVDLVYVLEDGVDERLEPHAARFCEMLSRALADSMGRGSLYRVDLRLRPFGGAGPVAPTMRAVETYYSSHADLWEAQALLRSRPICGGEGDINKATEKGRAKKGLSLWQRWAALVKQNCYKKILSDFTLSTILETRERIEQCADEQDLKRGPGGIRDVEFLTQVLQMTHGHSVPKVRVGPTVEALRALSQACILDSESAISLEHGYIFLRQVEHRCQLVDDQQTHSIPQTAEGKSHLAKLMGFDDWEILESELSFQRRRNRAIYRSVLTGTDKDLSVKDLVLEKVPSSVRPLIAAWFDGLPESAEFYRSLIENESSLHRIIDLVSAAPVLLPQLAANLAVSEAVISGEIEEPELIRLPTYRGTAPHEFASAVASKWLRAVVGWTFESDRNLGPALCELYDEILKGLANEMDTTFDIIALGSYGILDVGVESDLDVLLLAIDEVSHSRAEAQAQEFLAVLNGLKRFGWKKEIDLRLRPDGRKGLLVRSHSGLKTYELERMEMWERFALGNARLLWGSQESLNVAIKAAYALPLTPERLQELVTMKKRIETERVQPQYWKRDVKLGYGGLSDIDWFVHLYEMRYPTTLEVGRHITAGDRLKRMASAGLINAIEHEQTVKARAHLLKTRNFLALLGFTPDVLPENPDKLERLAQVSGHASGYEFQREHESIIESVRTIYVEGLERLGV